MSSHPALFDMSCLLPLATTCLAHGRPRSFKWSPKDQICNSRTSTAALFHPVTSIAEHLEHGPLIASAARGIWVKDESGRALMDFGAGLWCVNVGYGRTELADAAAVAMRNLSYFPLFFSCSSEPAIRLAERILSQFHDEAGARHLSKVFFGNSGSDANDTNFKLVRYYNNLRKLPRKKKIISRWGAYHGATMASASLTGIPWLP